MIALDTNVLVRFLVEDDRRQATRARSVVATAIAQNVQLYVSDIVACEVVWVLESAYGFGRGEIASVLNQLLHARHLKFRSTKLMLEAVEAYEVGKGDFADYLIRADAMDAGCAVVLTFDKELHGETHFRAP
jgi:predicted nucleic-acid-binding protein